MPDTRQMRVLKYIPEKLYGFTGDEAGQTFFHLGVFDPKGGWMRHPRCESCPREGCPWSSDPPPPIAGELVLVSLADGDTPIAGTNQHVPRAIKVERIHAPIPLQGYVETFDVTRGYGFIRGGDGKTYYLHRSEVTENRIPLKDQLVMFFAGSRDGHPRACHIRFCGGQS